MKKAPKNIALIGLGNWGKNLAKELHRLGVLASILSSSNEETRAWAKENLNGVSIKETQEDILNDPTIIAVVISTPIHTHFEIAKKALEANKHIFLEKPATDNSSQINLLVTEADTRNLSIQVGYEFIFSDKLKEIKESIQKKQLKSISFKWYKWGSFKAHPIINLLVHEISILKFLGIDNIKITKYEESKVELFPHKIYIEAVSENIPISFDIDISSEEKEKKVVITTTEDVLIWKDEKENLIEKELLSFISCINNNIKTFPDGKFAKEILEIIESIPYKK